MVTFIGLIRWLEELLFITGRLLYPAHLAIVFLLTLGLERFASRFPRLGSTVRTYTISALMFLGVIATPVSIYMAYAEPIALSQSQLPPLQGTPIDYDSTIRFLGYRQNSPDIEGNLYSMTLCWQILKTTTHPAAFSLKFVHNGVIVADRTSVLGMGRYPSSAWQTGTIWCDSVDLLMDDPDVVDDPLPQPGQVYDMLLILLNAQTQAVDWHAATTDGKPITLPIIGQVVSPAGDMSSTISTPLTPSTIDFPGFAQLQGYALVGALQPGANVNLSLLWSVTGKTSDNWSQFIHLIGANTAVVLADDAPRQGSYPTWAWQIGEKVADRWSLKIPADLPAGDYTVQIGFYRKDDNTRMPVTVNDQAVPDGSATLLQFHIG